MNRLGVRLVIGGLAAVGGLLILSFSMLAWLEGSPDGDGPGVGLGIALIAGSGALAAFICLLAGTGLLAVTRWRAGRWLSAMHSYAFYVGLSACALGVLITALAAR